MNAFNHPKPVMPDHMKAQSDTLRSADSLLSAATQGKRSWQAAEAGMIALLSGLARVLTAEERVAEERYNQEVSEYNAAVSKHNKALRDEKQARLNAADLRKVRQAACPRCSASHPGEC